MANYLSDSDNKPAGKSRVSGDALKNSVSSASKQKPLTIPGLRKKKKDGKAISMITAYDYPGAQAAEQADMDLILVGDSLAMVVLGHENTLSITVDEMLHHCKAVARGAKATIKIGDMPFMSYQADDVDALRNAGRFLKEGGMQAVKLEGGRELAPLVRRMTLAGIPVMGHIGLEPQRVFQYGGYKGQGKSPLAALSLVEDALALEAAGCFALVAEAIPAQVAEEISKRLEIPLIGIGSGVACDGQVLVWHDVLGLNQGHVPRFVKNFGSTNAVVLSALEDYRASVEGRSFPGDEQSFFMDAEDFASFRDLLASKFNKGN